MKHPDVYEIAIADTNLELIKTAQEKFGISSKDCYDNYDDMLKDDAIDAIHIVTPPSTHAEFSIKGRKTLWVYNPDGNEYSGVGRCH